MKCSLTPLLIAIAVLSVTHLTSAAAENVSSSNTDYGQAADLAIQPIAITNNTGNAIYQTYKLNQVAGSIPAARTLAPQRINPLEFFKDPAANLNRLFQQEYKQKPKPVEPLGFFKVPPLDSGVSVTVDRF